VENLTTIERGEQLRAALASLRRQESEAIAMCDLSELSYTDAAAALHVSVGTLKSRLSHGRAHLRAALSEQDGPTQQPDGSLDDPWPEPLSQMFAHTPGGTS
jgi:DNA-directed RNA polymerase specialized sigma24 family protein